MKPLSMIALFVVVGTFVLTSCATKVTRTDANKVTDIGGGWNDTDARMVATEMIKDCLSSNWINEFDKQTGRSPMVIVGTIRNKTLEHIDAQVFIEDLQKSLMNSGKVQFVANKDERQEIRDERTDQMAGNTEPTTISTKGHETGADFMLQGSMSAIKDAVDGKYAMFYQVSLELIDLKTNQKKWIGQKEIKKLVEKNAFKL